MPGRERTYPAKERFVIQTELEGQVVLKATRIQLRPDKPSRDQCFDLRGKSEGLRASSVIERLDAQPISRRKQPPCPPVPNGKGEHAVKMPGALSSPLLVRMDDDLRIGVGPERVAGRAEMTRQLLIVVDAAVEGDPDAAVFVGERLPPAFRIDDRQTPMPEPNRAVKIHAFTVRAPMRKDPRHRLKPRGLYRPSSCHHSGYPAHLPSFSSLPLYEKPAG